MRVSKTQKLRVITLIESYNNQKLSVSKTQKLRVITLIESYNNQKLSVSKTQKLRVITLNESYNTKKLRVITLNESLVTLDCKLKHAISMSLQSHRKKVQCFLTLNRNVVTVRHTSGTFD